MAFLFSNTILEGAFVFLLGIILVGLVRTWQKRAPPYFSPVSRLPGPPNHKFLFGNIVQIGSEYADLTQEWLAQYGRTFRFFGSFRVRFLFSSHFIESCLMLMIYLHIGAAAVHDGPAGNQPCHHTLYGLL